MLQMVVLLLGLGWMGGYGYAVVIDHGNGMSTLYGHNSELAVSEGQDVGKVKLLPMLVAQVIVQTTCTF